MMQLIIIIAIGIVLGLTLFKRGKNGAMNGLGVIFIVVIIGMCVHWNNESITPTQIERSK